MNVSVLGCGRWGSFLAWYSCKLGHNTLLWGRESSENLIQLKKERKNEFLSLQDNVILTDSLEEAVNHADYIIVSISSQNLRELSGNLNKFTLTGKKIILAMKGIEKITGLRLSEVVKEEIKQDAELAIWVGPGHVQAYFNSVPNCMLISSENTGLTKEIIDNFNSELIRLYIGEDLVGIEIGAAAKNVIGIAAGMLDGMNYSSLKGALMARGSREVSRLVKAMGGNEITVYGLSHIGDYEATLFSEYSNNRAFGENFIKHSKFDKLAEGVSTVESILFLAKKYNIDMPISQAIYSILIEGKEPTGVLKELFFRAVAYEF